LSLSEIGTNPTREKLSDNFYRDEFACRCGCGSDSISLLLVNRLQQVRDEIGNSIKITSGLRCLAHNQTVGGEVDSTHLTGRAVDISCTHNHKRMILLPVLCRFFHRVGVAKTFIHIDIDSTKDQGVLWLY